MDISSHLRDRLEGLLSNGFNQTVKHGEASYCLQIQASVLNVFYRHPETDWELIITARAGSFGYTELLPEHLIQLLLGVYARKLST